MMQRPYPSLAVSPGRLTNALLVLLGCIASVVPALVSTCLAYVPCYGQLLVSYEIQTAREDGIFSFWGIKGRSVSLFLLWVSFSSFLWHRCEYTSEELRAEVSPFFSLKSEFLFIPLASLWIYLWGIKGRSLSLFLLKSEFLFIPLASLWIALRN